MAHKKLKILYLAQYLQQQSDEEHPVSINDMIAYLEAMDIPAERKAIYDDLELLRAFGMDIVHIHGKTHGYYLGQREFELPELKLMIDVVQASPFLTAKKSMELIGKLEGLASNAQAKSLRRQVYVLNRVKTHNEQLYYNIDGINQAMTTVSGSNTLTGLRMGAVSIAGKATTIRNVLWPCVWIGIIT